MHALRIQIWLMYSVRYPGKECACRNSVCCLVGFWFSKIHIRITHACRSGVGREFAMLQAALRCGSISLVVGLELGLKKYHVPQVVHRLQQFDCCDVECCKENKIATNTAALYNHE
jgi:hypothetical protein